MRFHTKLYVRDGRVTCPRTEGWRSVEDCRRCGALERLRAEPGGDGYVECRPDLARPLHTLEKLISI